MDNHWTTLRRTIKLARPFWTGDAKWTAWGWLSLMLLGLLAISGINASISFAERSISTALQLKAADAFWQSLMYYGLIMVIAIPVIGSFGWVKGKLVLAWRDWLSRQFLSRYYDDAYFHRIDPAIDNRDQRIGQDVNIFCDKVVTICMVILDNVLAFIVFITILWMIDWKLVGVAMVYSAVGTVIMLRYGKRLIGMFANQEKLEAEFRRGMIYSAEHSISIASYQGSKRELSGAFARLREVVSHWNNLIRLQRNLGLFRVGYDYLILVVPMLMIVPIYLAGDTDFGAVTQAGSSFGRVLGALSIIVTQFQMFAELAASVTRLATFSEALERYEQEKCCAPVEGYIQTRFDDNLLELKQLTVRNSEDQTPLIAPVSVRLEKGQRLLVTGASGIGKSTFVRGVAGLLRLGSGEVIRPGGRDTLFLPQKPYMPLGTLRDQLTYPGESGSVSDDVLDDLLRTVELPDLVQRFGSLDAVRPWQDILSSGEQQKIAVARLLLAAPKCAILDEATSSLDIRSERHMYDLITASGITFISVAHRPSVLPAHDLVLELKKGGAYELHKASDYRFPD